MNDLKALFGATAVESFRTAPLNDRRHPLKRLFFPHDDDVEMARNTELALEQTFRTDVSWVQRRVRGLVALENYEAVSSFLGEVRAYGLLLSVGLAPKANSQRDSGPDFFIEDGVYVEVHSKQSEPAERLALQKHFKSPKAFHPNSPFGAPTSGDSVTTVAIQKIAQIKQKEERSKKQFSSTEPSILWLDFQDETWQLILGPEAALPVNLWNDEYYSGPLWYGFYGWKGAPVFDGETRLQRTRRVVARMGHEGRFRNHTKIDLIVVSLMRYTFLFENPFSTKPVRSYVIDRLLRLPNVDMTRSFVNGSEHDLAKRIETQKGELELIAKETVCGW